MFSTMEFYVNGKPISTFVGETIEPGHMAFAELWFTDDEMKNHSIEKVETITFPITLQNPTSFREYMSETFTFEP